MGLVSRLMTAMHRPVYAARRRALIRCIASHLREGDRLLDVGCGEGTLAAALLADPACPPGVTAAGLERAPRGGEPIDVIAYDGGPMPLGDDAADVVLIADVLHHEADPHALAAECVRVARRRLIVKDHQVRGVLAQQRISLIDWAANAPYGVPCLYRYNTPAQWRDFRTRHGLELIEEHDGMRIYPPLVNLMFGGSLHYLAVYGVPGAPPAAAEAGA